MAPSGKSAVPTYREQDMTAEAFNREYGKYQILHVRGSGARRKGPRPTLGSLRQVYKQYPRMVRNAFCLESAPWKEAPSPSSSSTQAGEPVQRLLGKPRPPAGRWYASFIVQHNKKALAAFLAKVLPAGAPSFLLPSPEQKGKPSSSSSRKGNTPHHSDALWVFFGKNPLPSPLVGRSEHTDAITHSGTWHVQLCGSKVWTLRPTAELVRKVRALRGVGSVRVRCEEGDVLCINTRLWWHSTQIPSNCTFTLSVARDMYLDGRKASDCDMTNVDGHYALKAISKNQVVFTEDTAPGLELPRSRNSNLGLREHAGKLLVVAKRRIKAGEWFTLSESETEEDEAGMPAMKRRKQ
eukprot:TRINITY_DN47596_c0_g1_i1.p1 TRINITY_DN47596_c0_g1~~TRINITY_DN47596_c0_g1_i1.p1  ORF type:complete len:352 (-),score=54.19 TRINITY_DN47596_c0_g1_i1:51-1106(-)